MSQELRPLSLRKDGVDRLMIEWTDGHQSRYTWRHLRESCPCAACREERAQPPDPFRILKPSELQPIKPLKIDPFGHYGYRIVWSDGHDSGIFTLENLRELCECDQCRK